MAYISFTDSTGAAQLDNGTTGIAGGVGSRFSNWVSDSKPVGVMKAALGTGAPVFFQFRVDYLATFELVDIPNANVTILDRLLAWLRAGGSVSVTTGDSLSAVYATCALAESGKAEKSLYNPTDQTWKVVLTLVNIAASPVPMTCLYT